MSKTQKILLLLFAIFICIQFFHSKENLSAQAVPNDLFVHYKAPDSVKQLVKTACYDCHSNNTTYPWYSRVQPVAWWLSDHITDGKRKLNFNEFSTYELKKADHKMEEVIEVLEKEEMPLKSYTLIHANARLSDAKRKSITTWAKQVRTQIQNPL
ncbi:MAG: heme-binding domain-containing protein [Flavobacterium sp.]|nr:heme-binding domain-containing protein [Pedobacter sp.]